GARRAFAAGLLAGFAMLMRGNSVFLVPAAAIVLLARPGRARVLPAYLAGVAIPVVAWIAAFRSATGHAPVDRNYLNVAFELYGRDLPWDEFETRIGARFHSMTEVLAFDPLHAAGRIAWNLVAHLGRDLRELVPPWIGALAV